MDNSTMIDSGIADQAASQLRQEYQAQQALIRAQPPIVQRFLEAQAHPLAEAVLQQLPNVHFKLPDRVVCEVEGPSKGRLTLVPDELREQVAGSLRIRFTQHNLPTALHQQLIELEESPNPAVAVSARLIRFATATYMVHSMLPAGRTVTYIAAEGEEIPTIPASGVLEPESAITARTDAIAEEGQVEAGRGELVVPYVPAARRFFLPQWVAFDDDGNLLVNSVAEAQAHLAAMQRYLSILQAAFGLAPYIIADDQYQQKRYGMLGQLINQGRAMARYETGEIVRTITRRAVANDLNRGLSLSLPYFNDQDLEMKMYEFEVIPAGRIMFVPAFIVRASRLEQVKVAQDTHLSPSTRKHLLVELKTLEQAFDELNDD